MCNGTNGRIVTNVENQLLINIKKRGTSSQGARDFPHSGDLNFDRRSLGWRSDLCREFSESQIHGDREQVFSNTFPSKH